MLINKCYNTQCEYIYIQCQLQQVLNKTATKPPGISKTQQMVSSYTYMLMVVAAAAHRATNTTADASPTPAQKVNKK